MNSQNWTTLPAGLPVPADDGAAAHLTGMKLPSIALPATTGGAVDLSAQRRLNVVFAYPRTGRPGEDPLTPDWDAIPGARGCTPHTCGFRDLFAEFRALKCAVYGLSTQDPAYQKEMTERLHVPFPVLSDAQLELTRALRLPTFTVAGEVLLKRLAWVADDGRITKVFYPIFPPDKNAEEVLSWLRGGSAK
jgi:peroxiredoxin (alkyl hydroperoxide reductase subunit C)